MSTATRVNLTFTSPERDADEPMAAIVHAVLDGTRVGHLAWYDCDDHPEHDENTVAYLDVDPSHRRQGIATALWDHVRGFNPDLHHSTVLTDDAEAWIASLPA